MLASVYFRGNISTSAMGVKKALSLEQGSDAGLVTSLISAKFVKTEIFIRTISLKNSAVKR